ncbi:hypothetical protein RRG08_018414 [Elysia crispata]|uniref:Uncharacterized protein n=1 Tax=Elysia crispata TaxID=231223 RepID=A0AAE1CKJ8_9GAST|nr:hypothetical protein RRG08_018414 [Elysia crispata]
MMAVVTATFREGSARSRPVAAVQTIDHSILSVQFEHARPWSSVDLSCPSRDTSSLSTTLDSPPVPET